MASSTPVAKRESFQCAWKPCAETFRSSGRNAPTKLGCGQSDDSSTSVTAPIGTNMRRSVPNTSRFTSTGTRCPAASGGIATVNPFLSQSRPAPGRASKTRPSSFTSGTERIPRGSETPNTISALGSSTNWCLSATPSRGGNVNAAVNPAVARKTGTRWIPRWRVSTRALERIDRESGRMISAPSCTCSASPFTSRRNTLAIAHDDERARRGSGFGPCSSPLRPSRCRGSGSDP